MHEFLWFLGLIKSGASDHRNINDLVYFLFLLIVLDYFCCSYTDAPRILLPVSVVGGPEQLVAVCCRFLCLCRSCISFLRLPSIQGSEEAHRVDLGPRTHPHVRLPDPHVWRRLQDAHLWLPDAHARRWDRITGCWGQSSFCCPRNIRFWFWSCFTEGIFDCKHGRLQKELARL